MDSGLKKSGGSSGRYSGPGSSFNSNRRVGAGQAAPPGWDPAEPKGKKALARHEKAESPAKERAEEAATKGKSKRVGSGGPMPPMGGPPMGGPPMGGPVGRTPIGGAPSPMGPPPMMGGGGPPIPPPMAAPTGMPPRGQAPVRSRATALRPAKTKGKAKAKARGKG